LTSNRTAAQPIAMASRPSLLMAVLLCASALAASGLTPGLRRATASVTRKVEKERARRLHRSDGQRWTRVRDYVKAEIKSATKKFLTDRGQSLLIPVDVDILALGFDGDGGYSYTMDSTLLEEMLAATLHEAGEVRRTGVPSTRSDRRQQQHPWVAARGCAGRAVAPVSARSGASAEGPSAPPTPHCLGPLPPRSPSPLHPPGGPARAAHTPRHPPAAAAARGLARAQICPTVWETGEQSGVCFQVNYNLMSPPEPDKSRNEEVRSTPLPPPPPSPCALGQTCALG
jgi:hypothetical protein